MSTTYRPINGKELRDMLKIRLNNQIDSIPLLKMGNTFKGLTFELAYEMSAIPSDVPVPNGDFKFEIKAPNMPEDLLREYETSKEEIEKVKELKEKITLRMNEYEEVFKNLEELEANVNKILEDFVVYKTDTLKDEGTPDKLRLENNLPIYVIKDVGQGMKAEVPISGKEVQFTKV